TGVALASLPSWSRAWEAAMARLRQRTAFLCGLVLGLLGLVALATAAEEGQASATPLKLESVLGRDVSSSDGDGRRVIDLLVAREGTARAAVVECGGCLGIGTRKIAIEWQAFRFYGRAIAVDVTREQRRAAPEYKSGEFPALVRAIND